MANPAFGAQERAAKALKKFKGTSEIGVEGLGTVGLDKTIGKKGEVIGITPSLELSDVGQANVGLFADIGAGAGAAAQGLQSGITGGAGDLLGAGRGLLSDVAGFDPLATASTRFDRLQSVLQPQRDRQRAASEARLLSQGRLDSSGGAAQLGAQEQAFAAEDAALLDRMFSEADNAAFRTRGQAADLIGGGSQLQGGLFGQLQQASAGRQAEFNPLFRLLGAQQGIDAGELNRLLGSSNALGSFNAAAAAGDGGSGLGEFITPLAVAAGTAFGGPLGGAAAGMLAGALTAPGGQPSPAAVSGGALGTTPGSQQTQMLADQQF